jgi:hypothetical protein
MSDGFRERLLSIGEAGSAHTNTTAASLLPAARKFTLPSYFFDRVGKSKVLAYVRDNSVPLRTTIPTALA